MPNSIVGIKFDLSTAVARLGLKRRAAAVPNSIHKLQISLNTLEYAQKFAQPFLYFCVLFLATAVPFDFHCVN